MKRILLTLLLVAACALPVRADTFILDSTQYFSLLSPLVPDTAGTGAGAPDSLNLTIVFQDGTIVLDSAWYNTGDAQGFAVNNRLLFTDQWQDIDGTSGVGTYSVIARWYDGSGAALTIEETHTVHRVWRSLNSAIDSTYAILDTLQNQDNWVAKEATLAAVYDTLVYAGGVWVDSAAGNTNTVVGTDGTPTNPVSTFVAAKTIATALGFNRYYIKGKGRLALSAIHENYEFIGLTDNITLDLGGQDVDGSYFKNLTITETQGGTGSAHFEDCIFDAVHDLSGHALRCGLTDTLRIGANNTMFFDQCYSMVAGNGTPVMMFGTGVLNVSIRHYSGGIRVDSVDTNDKVSIEGMGQVIVGNGCSNAPITIRGLFTITDNGTSTVFTRDAALNGGYIAEGTSDSVWLRQFTDLTGDAEYDAGDVIDSAKTWGATAASSLDSGIVQRVVSRTVFSNAASVDSSVATAVWGELQAGYSTNGTFGKFLDTTISSRGTVGATWAEAEKDSILDLIRLAPTDTMVMTLHNLKILPLATADTGLWISSKHGPAVLIEADSVGGFSNGLGAITVKADTGTALVIRTDTTNATDPAIYLKSHGDVFYMKSDSSAGIYMEVYDNGIDITSDAGSGLYVQGYDHGFEIYKSSNVAGAAIFIQGGTTGANDTGIAIYGDGPGIYVRSDQAAGLHVVGETYGALFTTDGAAGTAGMGITAATAGDGLVISGITNEIDFGGTPLASAALDADAQAAFGYAIFNHDISGYGTNGTAGKYIDTTISSISAGSGLDTLSDVYAAKLVDLVWDEDTTGHNTAASYGTFLNDSISNVSGAGVWNANEKDSIMALIDGSANQKLSLKGLRIVATGTDTAMVVTSADREAVLIQSAAANALPAVRIHNSGGTGVYVEANGSGDALRMDANGTGQTMELYSDASNALWIYKGSGSADVIDIENQGGSGAVLNLENQVGSSPVVNIHSVAGGNGSYGIQILNDNAKTDTAIHIEGQLFVDGGIDIDQSVTNAKAVNIEGNGTGQGLYVTDGGGAGANAVEFVGTSSGLKTSGAYGLYAQGSTYGALVEGQGTAGLYVWGSGSADGVHITAAGNGVEITAPSYDTSIWIQGRTFFDGSIYVTADANDTNAINLIGNGAGSGLYSIGGATGSGARFIGGATSGNGIAAQSPVSGAGISASATTLGDGLRLVGAGNGGYGLDISGNGDTAIYSAQTDSNFMGGFGGSATINGNDVYDAVWKKQGPDSVTFAAGSMGDSAKYWGRTAAGAAGVGAYSCSILVLNVATPVAGVNVWAYPNGGGTALKAQSDANGYAKFSVDADTFNVYMWASGYTQTSVPDTLHCPGAAHEDTLEVTAVAVSTPSSPSLTLVSFYFYDKNGVAIKEVPLSYELEVDRGQQVYHLDSAKIISVGRSGWSRSDANGKATFEVVPNDSIVVAPNELGTTRYRVRARDPRTGLPLLGPDGILLNVTASATEKRYPQDF